MAQTRGRRTRSWTATALWAIGILAVLFVLIQLVPYGHDHSNPPVANPFRWTDQRAAAIARASCYDCHSDRTRWWWATKIAPMSWLAHRDVSKARGIVNFSDWSGTLSAAEMSHALTSNMPPRQYTLIHPGAKLSDAEKQALLDGFQQSLAVNPSGPQGGGSSSASSGGETSSSDATAIINARCGTCHSAAPALQFRASSAGEAQAVIDQMVQQGATVTPAEEQTLIRYYTQ
jgi:hypothetical protein